MENKKWRKSSFDDMVRKVSRVVQVYIKYPGGTMSMWKCVKVFLKYNYLISAKRITAWNLAFLLPDFAFDSTNSGLTNLLTFHV